MLLDDTIDNRSIKKVAASMAVEDMFPSKEFISELIKVSQGEKTYEDLRQEIIHKYAR